MIKRTGKHLIFLGLLFIFLTVNLNADIYSWVDEKGVTHYSSTPPKGDTDLKVEVFKTDKPANDNKTYIRKNYFESSTIKKEQSQKPKVELYITSWCPWCKKAKSFFRSKNVELITYDIEKDKKAAQRKNQLDKKRGVPFAVVNGTPIHGYSEEAYNNALKQ